MSLDSLWNIFKFSGIRAYWHKHAKVFARWSRADLVEGSRGYVPGIWKEVYIFNKSGCFSEAFGYLVEASR